MLKEYELQNLNTMLLRRGAPSVKDDVGYNSVDYSRMSYLSTKTSWTVSECLLCANTLWKYTNTQLQDIKQELKETLEKLNKDIHKVTVVSSDEETITLTWYFDSSLSNTIKQLDRKNFRWKKHQNTWLFEVKRDYLFVLLPEFEAREFNIEDIQQAILNPETNKITTSELTVFRPKDSIDTLDIWVENSNIAISEVFRGIPYSKFTASSKIWTIYIEYASELYLKLEKLNTTHIILDLTKLQPWKDLVDSWDTNYSAKSFDNLKLKFKPYEFQLQDTQIMLEKHRILNANEMGCGKTHEAVRVGESLPMKKLVICPASLRLNWQSEIKFLNPKAKINILYDSSEFETSDWTIIGYPSIHKHLENLEKENFQCIFVDEAHYCQAISSAGTPNSKRAFSVLRLTATSNYVFPITGTPKTNRNKNLFNLLRMIKHPLTRGQWSFRDYGITYCEGMETQWGWDFEGNSNDTLLNNNIASYMIRHLKKDVLPNLKKLRMSIPVKVDLTEYEQEIDDYMRHRESKEAEQLARLMRAKRILATQKVGETISYARELLENGDKVVIVTCFTDVIKTLEKALHKHKVVKVVGGLSDVQKDNAIIEFQTGDSQVLLMNIIAGGVGITLTASHNIIFNDYDFVPGNIIQAEDRICRGGQTAEFCRVHYITAIGADVEEKFISMLTYKTETINNAIDGGEGESVDFRSLLEETRGIPRTNKVRKIMPVPTEPVQSVSTTSTKKKSPNKKKSSDSSIYKSMSVPELWKLANSLGVSCKTYSDERIQRMRLTMAIKSVTINN